MRLCVQHPKGPRHLRWIWLLVWKPWIEMAPALIPRQSRRKAWSWGLPPSSYPSKPWQREVAQKIRCPWLKSDLCTGTESVETATSSKSNSSEAARSDIMSRHASPSAKSKIDATSDILVTVTCEVLGVEEDERGLASKLVWGEENLLVANQTGADEGRHLFPRQHLTTKMSVFKL